MNYFVSLYHNLTKKYNSTAVKQLPAGIREFF